MRTIDDYPATITIEEAGRILGLSRSAAYRAAARGEIPTLRFGRRLVVPTARLFAMLGLRELRDDVEAVGAGSGGPAPHASTLSA
jgi:excisionase family DNA binding protein